MLFLGDKVIIPLLNIVFIAPCDLDLDLHFNLFISGKDHKVVAWVFCFGLGSFLHHSPIWVCLALVGPF